MPVSRAIFAREFESGNSRQRLGFEDVRPRVVVAVRHSHPRRRRKSLLDGHTGFVLHERRLCLRDEVFTRCRSKDIRRHRQSEKARERHHATEEAAVCLPLSRCAGRDGVAEQVAPQDVDDESWTQLAIDLDRRDRVVYSEPITEPIRRKLLQRDLGAHPFDGTARLGFERHKGDIGCSKRPCVVKARFGAEELRLIGGLTGLDVERPIDDAAPGYRRALHIDAGEYLLASLVDGEHQMDLPARFHQLLWSR